MGGFGQRAQKENQGVHDPLFAKALFLDNGQSRLLLLTTDLICVPTGLAAAAVEELAQDGLAADQVCICASHTHSGPEVMEFFVQTEAVQRYTGFLGKALVQVGQEARKNPLPTRLRIGTGQVDFLVNRRTKGDPNIVDPRVFALLAEEAETQRPLAVLFGVGVHPVTLGHDNFLISADYPGVAQKQIESQLGVQNALFFNMTEGNVIPTTRQPYNSLDTRGYVGGTFQDAEAIGLRLANEVLGILHAAPLTHHNGLFARRSTPKVKPNRYDLDMDTALQQLKGYQDCIAGYIGDDFSRFTPQDLTPLSTLWARASEEVVRREMSEAEMQHLMSAVCNYFILLQKLFNPAQQVDVPVPIQVIGIEEYRFLALPGEVLVEVGLDWQRRNGERGDKAFILGLANGFMGYLPHRTNFNEPGAHYQYETLMNALEPQAMDIAVDEGERLLLPS